MEHAVQRCFGKNPTAPAALRQSVPRNVGGASAPHCRRAPAEQAVQRCSQSWLQPLAAVQGVWASAPPAALRQSVPRIVGGAAAPHCRRAPAEQAVQRCVCFETL